MKKFSLLFTVLVLLLAVNNKTVVAAEWHSGIYVAPKLSYNYVVMDKLRMELYRPSGDRDSLSKGKNDDSFGLALAVGYDFDKRLGVPVRTELEYSYLGRASGSAAYREDLPSIPAIGTVTYKQKMNIQTVFLNAYFDINTGTPFTPYIGGGIGFAMIGVKKAKAVTTISPFSGTSISNPVSVGSKSQTNFAWNIGAGIGWDITPTITLDLGYRYMMLGEARSKWGNASGGASMAFYRTKVDDVNIHQVQLALRYTF